MTVLPPEHVILLIYITGWINSDETSGEFNPRPNRITVFFQENNFYLICFSTDGCLTYKHFRCLQPEIWDRIQIQSDATESLWMGWICYHFVSHRRRSQSGTARVHSHSPRTTEGAPGFQHLLGMPGKTIIITTLFILWAAFTLLQTRYAFQMSYILPVQINALCCYNISLECRIEFHCYNTMNYRKLYSHCYVCKI